MHPTPSSFSFRPRAFVLTFATIAALASSSLVLPNAAHAEDIPVTPATVGYGSSNPADADTSTMAAHAADRAIVDVTDFGADPTGGSDSAGAIADAVEHAKELDSPVTIRFPYGTYDIYPEQTEKRELYVSNTTGADAGPRDQEHRHPDRGHVRRHRRWRGVEVQLPRPADAVRGDPHRERHVHGVQHRLGRPEHDRPHGARHRRRERRAVPRHPGSARHALRARATARRPSSARRAP